MSTPVAITVVILAWLASLGILRCVWVIWRELHPYPDTLDLHDQPVCCDACEEQWAVDARFAAITADLESDTR